MARYICEKCNHKKVCQYKWMYCDSIVACNDWQSADVVPKSEVERLEYDKQILFDEGEAWHKKAKDLEVELKAMRGAANSYKMLYEKSKAEVAREIFGEIEKDIDMGLLVISKILNAKGGRSNGKTILISKYDVYIEAKKHLAKLKKKYTEDHT